MINLKYVIVDSDNYNGLTPTIIDGKLVKLASNKLAIYYLFHKTETILVTKGDPSENIQEEKEITYAVPVKVNINDGIDEIIEKLKVDSYNLISQQDEIKFMNKLYDKILNNPTDSDVTEYNELISKAKNELKKIGININESAKGINLFDVISVTSSLVQNDKTFDDVTAYSLKKFYKPWESYIGKSLEVGTKVTYNDKLFKVIQTVNPVLEIYPPSIYTASMYTEINETHAGTLEDPIPYSGNMRLELNKYYSQNGVTYKCIRDTGIAVYEDLATLVTVQGGSYVEKV